MALKHAEPMDVIDLNASGAPLGTHVSSSLLKSRQLQLMRVVLPAGRVLPEHHVPGEITIQCLSGKADVLASGRASQLVPGSLVMLSAAEPHGVRAHDDTVLLVTVVHS